MQYSKILNKQACLAGLIIFINTIRQCLCHSESTLLLVVSFDGFRHDYLDLAHRAGKKTPNFDSLIDNGVLAHHMKNAFITKTFPNHWTIATGLTEEHHGVVANEMYDPVFKETYRNNITQRRDSKWWNNGTTNSVEPIWFTNQKHNGRSGVVFWPGSQSTETLPFHYLPFDATLPNETRIDKLISWFATEVNPINFGMLYFDQPDALGHELGPSSPRMMDMIEELDGVLGYLIGQLKKHHLFNTMNLIVTSDHGMSDIESDKIIYLDDYLDPTLYNHYGSTPIWGIKPIEGNETFVYEALKKVPNADVYWKADIPEEYHYKYNRRIQPILLVAHNHYEIVHKKEDYDKWQEKGNHGFYNYLDEMHPIFIAHGPAFKKKHVFNESFNNTDLYSLFCHILDLTPAKNDGDFEEISHILRGPSDSWDSSLIISLIAIASCAVISCVVCIAACRSQRRRGPGKRQDFSVSVRLDNGHTDGRTHLLTSDEEEIP